jgi:hypothetical protein
MDYQAALIHAIFNTQEQLSNSPQAANLHQHEAGSSQAKATLHQLNALHVYQNNHLESGIRALSISYRTVFAIMDEGDFRMLCAAYLRAHPKSCFDWADYGEHFSEFMLSIDALASMPFLPELADIDWRLMHIERNANIEFDASSFSLLQTTPLEELVFVGAPGLQLNKVLFPVCELYGLAHNISSTANSALQGGDEAIPLASSVNKLIDDAIKSPAYRSIVLWREEYKGVFEYCDEASGSAILSMLAHHAISDVLGHFGEDQNAMTNWLQQQIQSKKIYAVAARN